MCSGGKRPAPPDLLPEAAQLPEQPSGPSTTTADADKKRRAAASAGGATGTILTGSRGVTQPGATTNKTLLGQ